MTLKRDCVKTDKAPKAIAAYSQAVWCGDMLFTSGQVPIDPATGKMVEGGIKEQARQAMENVKGILESQGMTMDQAIKLTIFLENMENFAAVNEVYTKYFSGDFPSRSAIGVAKLPLGAMVEIECIAAR